VRPQVAQRAAVGMPTARALVRTRRPLEPRFSSAIAREPSLSGLTHTWPAPTVASSLPCIPAGSWSTATTSPFCSAARLADEIRVRSSLIIRGAASIDHMPNCARNCAAERPWSGPR
jgi:hypothetical protein